MFTGIDHIEIVPGDFTRSLNFYTEILGFQVQWRRKVDRAPLDEIVFIELNGSVIELFSVKETVPAAATVPWQVGCRRIALAVEDMDKAIAHLKSRGVAIVRGPLAVENLTIAEIHDPDGLSIELIQRG